MPCLQPFRDDSAQLLLYKIAGCLADGGFTAGVSSFNGQTGSVVLSALDISTALGCTPACDNNVVTSFNGRQGVVTLLLADVSGVADARYVLKAGDTMTGALAIGNGTLAVASAPFLNLTQTWNNAAVAFTAFKSNVTATAAAAASLLFDVQQNAVSVLSLRTDGRLSLAGRASFTTTSSAGHSLAILDAGPGTSITTLTLNHALTGGTAAAGLGTNLDFVADSTTTTLVRQLRVNANWVDPTNATRTSQAIFTLPVAGVETATLTLTNGQVQVRNGTVLLPSVAAATDPDTGVFFNGTNDLFISSGGVLVLSATDTTGIIISTSLTLPYVAKTATYTASAVDYTIDCTANTFTINLPTSVGITGRIYVIKNSGIGTITVDPSGAELIDGLATSPVVAGGAAMIQSNGAGWIII